mmetsp:Transcript_16463/g.47306  ORF Transcript_16463/g.47306 Transcript_16463/m.47306 type:complete len:542 (-) Transcript_16463:91-1716(-)
MATLNSTLLLLFALLVFGHDVDLAGASFALGGRQARFPTKSNIQGKFDVQRNRFAFFPPTRCCVGMPKDDLMMLPSSTNPREHYSLYSPDRVNPGPLEKAGGRRESCGNSSFRTALVTISAGVTCLLLQGMLLLVTTGLAALEVHPAHASRFLGSKVAAYASDDLDMNLPPRSTRLDPFALRDSLNDPATRKGAEESLKNMNDRYSKVVGAGSASAPAVDPYDIVGVGVPFTQRGKEYPIIVAAPPRVGSSAEAAGLKSGDIVVAVNGVSTKGRTSFDIVDQVFQDMEASTVTLSILPGGADVSASPSDLREVVIERDFSGVPKPLGYKVSEVREDGTKVGYIQLRKFYSTETAALKNALTALNEEGVNAYVIDVRGNGGGVFQSALGSASLFLDEKVAAFIVDEENLDVIPYLTSKGKVAVDPSVPVVIWTDKKSASSTEIFASALRDNCRALVVGETTFGKGLIQALVGLEDGSRLIFTVARYVTPEGRNVEGEGITPDLPGRGVINPQYLFGKRTDTSKVDFVEAASMLSSICPSKDR